MIKLIIVSLFVAAVFAVQNLPVPHKQIGIMTGDKNAEIQLELIYDPVCDNTADFDSKLQQVLHQLTEEERKKISVKFIVLPLPFHMSAHKIVQGIIYVLEKKGNKEALELMRNFLATKEEWFEMKVRQESIQYLTQRIAQKINRLFNLDVQKTMKALRFGSKADKRVREWSKISMGVLKASGTPRMSINRAPIDDVMFITSQRLRTLIREMLSSTKISESIDQN